jgi:hypothetical protein
VSLIRRSAAIAGAGALGLALAQPPPFQRATLADIAHVERTRHEKRATPRDGSFFFAQGKRSAFLPNSLSGLVFWVRADLGVTSSTTFTWADQSGTADPNKNCTATGTARPTLNASNSSYNNKPTIDYNGTTNYLQSGVWSVALAQPFTEFVVGHTPNAATAILAAANLTGTECDSRSLANTPSIYAGTVVNSTGGWTTPSVLGAVYNGASSNVYLNSHVSTVSGGTNAGTNGRTGMILGDYALALQANNNWGHGGGGSFAEIITYNRILSGSEITQVMTYIGTRYGITIA